MLKKNNKDNKSKINDYVFKSMRISIYVQINQITENNNNKGYNSR